jgi:hypothetical protein
VLLEILDASGRALASVTGYHTLIADMPAATVLVPEPVAGWHAVRAPGYNALGFSEPVSVPQP